MIAFRKAEPHDRRFIIDAWLRSWQMDQSAGLVASEDWFSVMIPQVTKILDRPSVTTMVAFEAEEPNRISDLYGFLVADISSSPPLVYYVFVKQPYRRLGCARELFRAVGIDPNRRLEFTCKTRIVGELLRAGKLPIARYNQTRGRFPNAETYERRTKRAHHDDTRQR